MESLEAKSRLLVEHVNQVLAVRYRELKCGEAVPAARGLSFLVCRADSVRGPLAIRVPYGASVSGNKRARQYARRLLEQESFFAGYTAEFGLPSARAHFHHRDPLLDFLVSDFVEVDGTTADSFALGSILGCLHRLPTARRRLVEVGGRTVAHMLAARIRRRLDLAERLFGLRLPLSVEAALAMLVQAPRERSLLHMDVRPENWLVTGGQVTAIVDWENALVSHPRLELARMAEAGLLDSALLAGYRSVMPVEEVPEEVDLLYRLDTALLLAAVYSIAVEDLEKAKHYAERVTELHGRVWRASA